MGIVEASDDKIGSLADRVMLYCYHYDPSTGQYGLMAMRLCEGGRLFVLAMVAGWGPASGPWPVFVASDRRALHGYPKIAHPLSQQASTLAGRVDTCTSSCSR